MTRAEMLRRPGLFCGRYRVRYIAAIAASSSSADCSSVGTGARGRWVGCWLTDGPSSCSARPGVAGGFAGSGWIAASGVPGAAAGSGGAVGVAGVPGAGCAPVGVVVGAVVGATGVGLVVGPGIGVGLAVGVAVVVGRC